MSPEDSNGNAAHKRRRTDHITFDDIDISWRSVIDVDFTGIVSF